MSRIEVAGLSKQFGSNVVVDELDLVVQEGEFVSLLGPSGCGKTTTLRCIAGLESPDSGAIRADGVPVYDAGAGVNVPPNKRGFSMVFQNYALWPHMSVRDNVAYPLSVRRVRGEESRRRASEALALVGLEAYGNRAPSTLSGGQQQRVALARAVVASPRLLLLDEPLSNLDAALRVQMRAELQRLHRESGTTSIYVTHDRLEAVTLSDRVVVLADGIIQQIGPPEEIFSRPANAWVAGFVGFENLESGRVAGRRGNHLLVEVPGWNTTVECQPSPSVVQGEAVVVGVRASSFDPYGDSFSGTVSERTYLGSQVEYTVDISGIRATIHVDATSPIATDWRAGDLIRFGVSPDAVVVMPPGKRLTRS